MSTTLPNPTPGETSLPTLLASMQPTLDNQTYIFLTIPPSHPSHPSSSSSNLSTLFTTLQPLMIYTEPEGLTVITTPSLASAAGYTDFVFECRKITLQIHSSLEAVGLMAKVSGALAKAGVSANVVSGFYHDHFFVPVGREGVAIGVLEGVVREARGEVVG
ncbi:hypothetical protein BDV06DRAFT_223666 [Aspergillus oleicola]